jgi:hypothetical protein
MSGAQLAKPIFSDGLRTLKEAATDMLIDPIKSPAIDKLITDPIQTYFEGIFDPRLPGGGVVNPPIWGLPGLRF